MVVFCLRHVLTDGTESVDAVRDCRPVQQTGLRSQEIARLGREAPASAANGNGLTRAIRAMIRPSGPPVRYEFPARADEVETRHEP